MKTRATTGLLMGFLIPTVWALDTYTIDSHHTMPMFEVNHLGFSTQRGRFDRAEGAITLDVEKHSGRVMFKIHADSIDMGFDQWNDHMKSKDFFNVIDYPEITFTSESIRFNGEDPVSADGTLSLLGVTKPLRIAITHFKCGNNPITKKEVCAGDIETKLKRSDFGMNTYLPAIGDDIVVKVPVEAIKD